MGSADAVTTVGDHLMSETFLGLTATGWAGIAAIATAAAVLIALLGAWFGWRQLKSVLEQGNDARVAALEASRPYVVVTIEPTEVGQSAMDLVIRNSGQRPAHDVRVRLTPDPVRAEEIPGYELAKSRILSEEITVIVPGQRLTTYFDSVRERLERLDLPERFQARMTYRDSTGNIFDEEMVVDFAVLKGTVYTNVLSTHHQVEVLREIRDHLKKASALQRHGTLKVEATTERREVAAERQAVEENELRHRRQSQHQRLVSQLLPEAAATEGDRSHDKG